MAHHFYKMKNLDYWLPIIFAVAIGTGLLIGVAVDAMWFGLMLGILLGACVLFLFYKFRSSKVE